LVLSTNGSELTTKMTATVPGYPIRVFYDLKTKKNLFEFHKMEKPCQITYDSKKEKSFIVHLEKEEKLSLGKLQTDSIITNKRSQTLKRT
jgi:hypothetical protein